MVAWEPPPWSPALDERAASDLGPFRNCEGVLADFAAHANGRMIQETYTTSKQFGRVIRARIAFPSRGSHATIFVVCWSESDGSVQMAVKTDDGGR